MSDDPLARSKTDASTPAGFRRRLIAFALIALAMSAVAAAYVVSAVTRKGAAAAAQAAPQRTPAASATAQELAVVARGAHLMFRNLQLEPDRDFGRLALAELDPAGEARALSSLRCVRVHYAAGRGICLEMENEDARKATLRVFGSDLAPRWSLQLDGLPSRARVSPDGKLGAVTVFVTGHSYSDGDMSTRTTLLDLENQKVIAEDLETFQVTRDGQRFAATNFNYWGVTFGADSNRFHATLSSGDKTWLIEGNIADKTLRTLRENVECPSRSPDGTRLAFKKRIGGPGAWRLHVLDLATLQERGLGDDRSIDDQVEWLDDQRLLYKHGPNVYVLPVDGGPPRTYLTRASSPAVVRAAR